MNEVLFLKTCCLVGGMLVFTAIGSKINKEFETKLETYITFAGLIGFMFLVHVHRNEFPMNLFCLFMVSVFMGWALGPAIRGLGKRYMFRKYLGTIGISTKTQRIYKWYSDRPIKKLVYYYDNNPDKLLEENSPEIVKVKGEFENQLCLDELNIHARNWKNLVTVAMISTALCVFLTAGFVWFSDTDFGFLKGTLCLVLTILGIYKLQRMLIPNSSIYTMPLTVIGILHAVVLLVYDFNRLEKLIAKGDESWSTAVNMSLSIYLDIIWLLINILEFFANEA